MIRLVVVGANGQLGAEICDVFSAAEGYSVIPLTRRDADLEQAYAITAKLAQIGEFDVLINCAAYTDTEKCEKERVRAYCVNSYAAAEMAVFCRERAVTMIHISTDYVFDGKKGVPYTEEDKAAPLSVYGASKLLGEKLVLSRLEQAFILRVSALFGRAGKKGTGKNFVETVIALAQAGGELNIVADQFISPTHTLDVARAVQALIDKRVPHYGIYHCAGEGACSWHEFAGEILAQLDYKNTLRPIRSAQYSTGVRRPAYSVLDTAKLQKIIPPKNWRDALAEYLQLRGSMVSGVFQ